MESPAPAIRPVGRLLLLCRDSGDRTATSDGRLSPRGVRSADPLGSAACAWPFPSPGTILVDSVSDYGPAQQRAALQLPEYRTDHGQRGPCSNHQRYDAAVHCLVDGIVPRGAADNLQDGWRAVGSCRRGVHQPPLCGDGRHAVTWDRAMPRRCAELRFLRAVGTSAFDPSCAVAGGNLSTAVLDFHHGNIGRDRRPAVEPTSANCRDVARPWWSRPVWNVHRLHRIL